MHRGYLDAPEETLRAIVVFVQAKRRSLRNAARRELLVYELPATGLRRPVERVRPEDARMAERLRRAHSTLNRERFGGALSEIPIRVSRRMRSRLGHYTHRDKTGAGAEIVISRRHIRRHGWSEAIETLLHEMVHQWQDETGLSVDHGRQFRAKARAVGITPTARRDVA
ncbi:MAG: SprT-like domain-containing protein [Gemmatimonadaceae bacterium]